MMINPSGLTRSERIQKIVAIAVNEPQPGVIQGSPADDKVDAILFRQFADDGNVAPDPVFFLYTSIPVVDHLVGRRDEFGDREPVTIGSSGEVEIIP